MDEQEIQAAPEVPQAPEVATPAPDPNEARFANLEQRLSELPAALTQAMAPKPAAPDLEALFDAQTKEFVDKRIERRVNETVAQIIQQNTLNANPELKAEAIKSFATLRQNPMWVNATEAQLNSMAIAEAKANLAERKATQTTQQNTQQAAAATARNQAAGATLPSTGGGNTQPSANDREAFVKGFMAEQGNRDMVRIGDRVDPDSPRGQELLRQTAELNYSKPVAFGGATARAMNHLANQVEVVR